MCTCLFTNTTLLARVGIFGPQIGEVEIGKDVAVYRRPYLSVDLSVRRSICRFAGLSVFPSIRSFVRIFVRCNEHHRAIASSSFPWMT
jgi:hypothetical protein